MSKKKTILITGCSSGIGLETAILCAKRGHKVVATMRNLDKAEPLQEKANTKHVKLSIKQCDVNNQASVDNCINETINEFGQIDVLINNAGYGLISPLETIKIEEAEAQFQTNFFGVIRMIQAVMPIMRKQKMGKIINVSSIAGIEGNALFGVYSATKFALEGLSESLAQEVKRYGIQVKLIEPGPVDTSFGRETNLKTGTRLEQMTPEYKRMQKDILEYYKHQNIFPDTQRTEDAALIYLEAVEDDSSKFRYPTSKSAENFIKKKIKIL